MNTTAQSVNTSDSVKSAPLSHEDTLNSVKQLLKNRIFSGRYEERRLIEVGSMSMYKDVIVVDKSEIELAKALKTANLLLRKHFQGNIITCIAEGENGSPNSHLIYTNLAGVSLGGHWFQIKNVLLNGNVFHISMKSLRPLKSDTESSSNANFSSDFSRINRDFIKQGIARCSESITMENIVTFFRFLLVLLITFLIGCYHLLELLLRGVKELNTFVHNITPVLVACVDGITKMFGGLLILIAMMWNSKKNKNAPYYQHPPRNFLANSPPYYPMIMNNPTDRQSPPMKY